MANLKELISKGTADSLAKLSDEELGKQQCYAFQQFLIASVRQAAINAEQEKRDLVMNWKVIDAYMRDIGEQIKADDDLFCLKKES